MIGSPNDVKDERNMMSDIISRINRHIASPLGYHLELIKWEDNAYPDFHSNGPQGTLDPILDFPQCDIFVGIFWHRFGTVTKDGATGTEHEFNQAVKEWRKNKKSHHIMFYFNQKAYTPRSHDEIWQWGNVLKFKESFPKEGFYWNYNGKEEFEKLIYDHLANILNKNYTNNEFINQEISKKEKLNSFSRPEKFEGEHSIFVGRDKQVEKIMEYLEDFVKEKSNSPITIWGMGGIGKSALAYNVMHKFEKIHQIQIIPLYFEVKPTFNDILNTIAIHLNLNDVNFMGKDKQEVLLSNIQNKRLLIYADGFELVSGSNEDYKEESTHIIKFLERFPSNTIILATSRENRNFLNEKLIHLEDLDMNDAIYLFAKIAKIDPNLQRQNIEKIIRLVSNHPLALEIIAHSYEKQGLTNLISDVQKYGIVSHKYGSTSEERQHTIESCIGFSFERLDSKLQTILTGLAQLHSPFSNELVQNTFNAKSLDVPFLYNRTMITHAIKSSPYGDLKEENYLYDFHSLVKYYLKKQITEKLDQRIISHYYLDFLKKIYNSLDQSHTSQYIRQLSVMLESDENHFTFLSSLHDVQIQKNILLCYSYIGLILYNLGNYSKSLEYHNKALKINTEMGYKEGIGRDHTNIGLVLKDISKYKEALDSHNKALKISTEMGYKEGIGRDHNNIGIVLRCMGRYKEALDSFNKSLIIRTEMKNKHGTGLLYRNIGNTLQNMRKYKEALDSHNKALKISTEMGNKAEMGGDHNNIGVVLENMGRYKEALESYNKSLEISTEMGNKIRIVTSCRNIGLLLKDLKKIDESRDSLTKALNIIKELEMISGYRHPFYEKLTNDLKRLG